MGLNQSSMFALIFLRSLASPAALKRSIPIIISDLPNFHENYYGNSALETLMVLNY